MTRAAHRPSVLGAHDAASCFTINRCITVLSLVLIVLPSTTLMTGCLKRRTIYDYGFSVTGVVMTENSVPLPDADVILVVNGPVYEVIDLVKTRHVLTTAAGGFVFAYISHERGVKYTITVRKEDFEPQTVAGISRAANHVIRLKK